MVHLDDWGGCLSAVVWWAVTSVVCITTSNAETSSPLSKATFHVKPGGQLQTYVHKEGDLFCTFEYACQGGTSEEWLLELEKEKDKVHCRVFRPSGTSYLFFESFKLSVTSPVGDWLIRENEAYGNNLKILEPSQTDKSANEVWSRKGTFKNELAALRVMAEASGHAKEL